MTSNPAEWEVGQVLRDAMIFIADGVDGFIVNADLPEPYQGYDDEEREPFYAALRSIARELRAQGKATS